MANNYSDIINLPHPTSKKHPRMTVYNRAAQFSPFAALTGYDEAVKESARLTTEKVELDESQIASINEKINKALSVKETHPEVKITYFLPDAKKKGGEYLTLSGVIKRIDEVNHNIIMMDKTEIDIFSIIDIESDIYEILDEYEGEN